MKVNICTLDKPNKNGHIYPERVMQESIAVINRHVHGFIGMDGVFEKSMSTATHIIDNLRIEDNDVVGELIVSDNEYGAMLKPLLDDIAAGKFQFRMAGIGEIDDNTGIVSEFNLLSVNLVTDGA